MNTSCLSDRYDLKSMYISQAKPVDLKDWNNENPRMYAASKLKDDK